MYAQLVMLRLGPRARSTGEKLADQFAPAIRTLKGFKGVTFFGDEIVGEYGSLSLWESWEDVKAASAVLGPKLEQAVSSIAKAPLTRRFFEVYESKA